MRRILVDTSAWGAIADSNDPNHEIALLFQEEITGRCQLVITNYIHVTADLSEDEGDDGGCGCRVGARGRGGEALASLLLGVCLVTIARARIKRR